MLARNIEARLLSQSEQMRVVAHLFISQLLAQTGEILVAGLCQRFGQIHFGVAVVDNGGRNLA